MRLSSADRSLALALMLVFALGALGACGSDEWSAVGSGLPTDTSQDSVSIALPPIFAVTADVVTPLDTLVAADRPAMYLGQRDGGAWRATPLLQFDVGGDVVQSRLPIDWDTVQRVEMALRPMVQADSAAVVRDITAYELALPLTAADLAVADVTQLFSTAFADTTWNKRAVGEVRVPKSLVESWVIAGIHNGIAVFHDAPPTAANLYSNFAGYGGADFNANSRLWDTAYRGRPVLQVQFTDASENFEIPVLETLTHFERDLPGPDDLQIGSYFERRLWINFGLTADVVPVDATINSGTLVLQVRQDLTMQVRPYSRTAFGPIIIDQQIVAWEAARSEAGDTPGVTQAWNRSNRRVLEAFAGFNPDPGNGVDDPLEVMEFRIDVTEYVQRQANQIVPDDLPPGTTVQQVGLLLAFEREQLDLDLGVFYGPNATDDLKPRLEITYTPPADSWQ